MTFLRDFFDSVLCIRRTESDSRFGKALRSNPPRAASLSKKLISEPGLASLNKEFICSVLNKPDDGSSNPEAPKSGRHHARSSSASGTSITDRGNPQEFFVGLQNEDNGRIRPIPRELLDRSPCGMEEQHHLSRQIITEIEELEREVESLERIIVGLKGPEWMIIKLGKSVQVYISRGFRNALVKIENAMVDLFARIVLTISPPKRLCIVCTETKPVPKFPHRKITGGCEHEPEVCSKDLQIWIISELESKGWQRISCPECKELLQHSDIQELASKKTFARYEKLVTRAIQSADPNFRWCLNAGCSSGQIHEDGKNGPIFTCIECKTKICTFHERAWHKGETCEQFDRRVIAEKQKAEEAASAAVIKKIARKCPGKPGQPCGWNIVKIAGCDHMTCSRCGGEFCYICLAFYDPIRKQGNSMHHSTCKYHSDNISRH